jgi:hypothetical protein
MTKPNLKKPRVSEKAKVTRPKGRRWQHEMDVVGLRFRFKKDGRRALADTIAKRGSITGIRLIREPDNRADANAIMVCLPERMLNGTQLGYIRALSAELLAPKLDSGRLVVASAKLEWLDPSDEWNTGNLLVHFIDVDKPKKASK